MKPTSPAFEHGGKIPSKTPCEGQRINPPLTISQLPVTCASPWAESEMKEPVPLAIVTVVTMGPPVTVAPPVRPIIESVPAWVSLVIIVIPVVVVATCVGMALVVFVGIPFVVMVPVVMPVVAEMVTPTAITTDVKPEGVMG